MSNYKVIKIDTDEEELSDEEEDEDFNENGENSDSEIFRGQTNTTALNKAAREHLNEIYDILECRQEVNYKNALVMNQEMLKRLEEVREQITILELKCKERYAANEMFLKENMKTKKNNNLEGVFGKFNRGEKFYIKGSIYFKDENKRNAPNNEDYLERQKQGEMFPMDFEMTSRHVWSITDKMSIIRGIKEQIYEDKTLRKRFKNKNQKLETMLKAVGANFEIDWVQMSVHNLKYRHTPTSCKAMFEVYLHPSLKHDAFTHDENQRLAEAAEKYNLQNWAAIAAEVGQRSDYQCFLQYRTTPSFRAPYVRWDKSADDLLLKSVEASKCNGVINWSQIAYLFPNKSRTSLQQRYHYCLNPSISHEPFTGEEDLLLLAAVQEYGTNFAKFPRSLFPNRSTVQLRSRYYNTLQTRHKSCPWTIEDDRIMLKFVEEHGMAWKKCAEFMEHRHTRTSCRQRYMVIQKHKETNADFKLEDLVRRPYRMMKTDVTADNWLNKVELLRANPELTAAETTKPFKKTRPRKRQLLREAHGLGPDDPLPKKPRDSKKKIYTDRLRQCGMLYHNFFKYSYNFRFGKPTQYTPISIYANEREQAIERLGFHMPGKKDEILQRSQQQQRQIATKVAKKGATATAAAAMSINGIYVPLQRRLALAEFIKQRIPEGMVLEPDGGQMAPNFSTLTALRALCVLSADNMKRKEEEKNETEQSKSKSERKTQCKSKAKKTEKAENVIRDSDGDGSDDDVVKVKSEDEIEIKIKSENEFETENEDELLVSKVATPPPPTTTANVAATTSLPTIGLKKTLSSEEFNNVPAIVRFRQRFRALFYQAAGMSRLPPSSIPNKNFTETSQNIPGIGPTTTTTTVTTTNENASMQTSPAAASTAQTAATTSTNIATTSIIKQEPETEFMEGDGDADDSSFLDIVVKHENDLEHLPENH